MTPALGRSRSGSTCHRKATSLLLWQRHRSRLRADPHPLCERCGQRAEPQQLQVRVPELRDVPHEHRQKHHPPAGQRPPQPVWVGTCAWASHPTAGRQTHILPGSAATSCAGSLTPDQLRAVAAAAPVPAACFSSTASRPRTVHVPSTQLWFWPGLSHRAPLPGAVPPTIPHYPTSPRCPHPAPPVSSQRPSGPAGSSAHTLSPTQPHTPSVPLGTEQRDAAPLSAGVRGKARSEGGSGRGPVQGSAVPSWHPPDALLPPFPSTACAPTTVPPATACAASSACAAGTTR